MQSLCMLTCTVMPSTEHGKGHLLDFRDAGTCTDLTSPAQGHGLRMTWLTGRAALGVPALQGKAMCVSHSASARGAGEVSSANYEARAFGVRAGMFIGDAHRRCPNLIVMPYDFEKYEDISDKVRSLLDGTFDCFLHVICEGTPPTAVPKAGPDHLQRLL